jgi:hypothetical protein
VVFFLVVEVVFLLAHLLLGVCFVFCVFSGLLFGCAVCRGLFWLGVVEEFLVVMGAEGGQKLNIKESSMTSETTVGR